MIQPFISNNEAKLFVNINNHHRHACRYFTPPESRAPCTTSVSTDCRSSTSSDISGVSDCILLNNGCSAGFPESLKKRKEKEGLQA